MSDLRDELRTVNGIGEAKASEIMDILAEHDTEMSPYMAKAKEAADAGNDREAALYLRRAGGE